MTLTTPPVAGSPQYLDLLASTAFHALDLDIDEESLGFSLDYYWEQLTQTDSQIPALHLIARNGLALLCSRTGTPIPHLAADAATIHIDKNAGYAGIGNKDPWANFRLSQAFGISPYKGVLVRMSDKYIRLRNLRANPANDRVGESINDTLTDLIAYALIAVCLSQEDGGSV